MGSEVKSKKEILAFQHWQHPRLFPSGAGCSGPGPCSVHTHGVATRFVRSEKADVGGVMARSLMPVPQHGESVFACTQPSFQKGGSVSWDLLVPTLTVSLLDADATSAGRPFRPVGFPSPRSGLCQTASDP